MSNLITPKEATRALLTQQTKLTEEERAQLLNESIDILDKCNRPGAGNGKAGLVIGYVQSGKTLSLTTVTSLARDNGYGLTIILCGVTKILFEKNSNRLDEELVANMPKRFFTSLRRDEYKPDTLSSFLKGWSSNKKDPSLLIYVLKNQKNIRKLADALSKCRDNIHKNTPTLIIDDEAHMAGLNTSQREGDESEVYASIKALRETLPDHTYLQYTATPQAPLLVEIADCVSPEFAVTLTPGKAYVGGKDMFASEAIRSFVKSIPDDELPSEGNYEESAPPSLDRALLLFLVGLSDGIAKGEAELTDKNRTMLVHPGSAQKSHDLYAGHVKALLDAYEVTLSPHGETISRQHLLECIQAEYNDLKATYPQISPLEVIAETMPAAINMANGGVQKLNAKTVNKVDWMKYAHILVGGEVLGVGFTVEGLTVTYMPREASNGQADSMQQRARFLGYRKGYIGLCRIFLSDDDRDLYQSYVTQEEDMRSELAEMTKQKKTIKEWRRNFLVHSRLRLTRANIQSLETTRYKLQRRCYPNAPFKCPTTKHRELYEHIRNHYKFNLDTLYRDGWGDLQRHLSTRIPMSEALEIINRFEWADPNDSRRWSVSYLILKALRESAESDSSCKLTLMSPVSEKQPGRRSRKVKNGVWDSFFQNRNPNDGPNTYPGDQRLEDPTCLTIQLYDFQLNFHEDFKILDKIDSVIVPVVIPGNDMMNQIDLVRE